MRALGIDYGTKRIGVAISDDAGAIAYPRTTIKTGRTALDEVEKLARDERVQAVVMGDSRNSNMEANSIMEEARKFGEELAHRLGVPIHFELESFTTAAALTMRGAIKKRSVDRPSRAPHKNETHDAAAAAILLQRFLERADGNPWN